MHSLNYVLKLALRLSKIITANVSDEQELLIEKLENALSNKHNILNVHKRVRKNNQLYDLRDMKTMLRQCKNILKINKCANRLRVVFFFLLGQLFLYLNM